MRIKRIWGIRGIEEGLGRLGGLREIITRMIYKSTKNFWSEPLTGLQLKN